MPRMTIITIRLIKEATIHFMFPDFIPIKEDIKENIPANRANPKEMLNQVILRVSAPLSTANVNNPNETLINKIAPLKRTSPR